MLAEEEGGAVDCAGEECGRGGVVKVAFACWGLVGVVCEYVRFILHRNVRIRCMLGETLGKDAPDVYTSTNVSP